MLYLLLSLLALGVITALLTALFHKKGEEDVVVQPPASDCSSCDGTIAKCEQVCMMEAAVKDVEYFDDEELDVFKGRPSDSYSDEEVNQFSDVLYTLKPDEVRAWGRSLNLRGINLPDQIKDEYISMA